MGRWRPPGTHITLVSLWLKMKQIFWLCKKLNEFRMQIVHKKMTWGQLHQISWIYMCVLYRRSLYDLQTEGVTVGLYLQDRDVSATPCETTQKRRCDFTGLNGSIPSSPITWFSLACQWVNSSFTVQCSKHFYTSSLTLFTLCTHFEGIFTYRRSLYI